MTITEPAVLVATCSVVSNVSCNGGSDGAFNVSASGGTGPYTGTGGYAGAVAGTNNITVTDANGCTATCSVTITEPAVLVATCTVVSQVTCNGGTDGSASVSASGGTTPYTGEGTFTGLAAGTYSYTVTDANGCTASCSVTITEPAALVATCSVISNVTCNGGSDGSASVSASGGSAPYSGEGTFTGLSAGTYSYTVTDANGCTATCSVTITEPAALVATCTVVSNVSCNGGSDGAFNVSASGGTGPFTGTGGYAGAVAGTNTITVTDANGCTATCSVTITEPAALVATCTVVSNVSCNGGSDGAFNVSASGGTGPYTGTGGYAGAVAGTNTITVTDANGCTATCSVTITEPAALVATCSVVSNVSCNGGTDGSASVSASGGTSPYSGTGSFTRLSAGTYNYTVTDANGCTASCSITISEPAALVATCSVVSNVTCNGGSDGSASVSASGGTAPYSGEGTFTGLAAGTYSYTVTDASGCTATCSVTITEPAALVATCSVVSNVTCNGGSDGSASVSASVEQLHIQEKEHSQALLQEHILIQLLMQTVAQLHVL
ncbi:MAG: SprB repeat-containing protein [Bacteroidetes bacterium]|nr:SprB repeat-containing protein [Bacteroidota bacterium]